MAFASTSDSPRNRREFERCRRLTMWPTDPTTWWRIQELEERIDRIADIIDALPRSDAGVRAATYRTLFQQYLEAFFVELAR